MENQKNKIQKFVNGLKATRMTDGQASFILSPDSVFGERSNGEECTNDGGCSSAVNDKGCTNSGDCSTATNKSGCTNSGTCTVNVSTQAGCGQC